MPENEDSGKDAPPASASPGLFAGKRGWITVIGVVSLNVAFTAALMYMRDTPPEGLRSPDAEPKGEELGDLDRIVKIDPINFTLPSGSQRFVMTLELDLQLGRTAEERANPDVNPTNAELDKVKEVVEKLKPQIIDRLYRFIGQTPVNNLQGPAGQERVCGEVQQFVNERLHKIDFGKELRTAVNRNRVTSVLIQKYHFDASQ